MFELLAQKWPWYISGILLGLMVPILLYFGNRHFGISSSFRHLCAAIIPNKIDFFNYDWKKQSWNLVLVSGIIIGAFFANHFLVGEELLDINKKTVEHWTAKGIHQSEANLIPIELFNLENTLGIILLIVGGFLIGFGTRYANGCTSGHAIMGLSLLNPGSLLAVIGFFIGGLTMVYFIFPFIF